MLFACTLNHNVIYYRFTYKKVINDDKDELKQTAHAVIAIAIRMYS